MTFLRRANHQNHLRNRHVGRIAALCALLAWGIGSARADTTTQQKRAMLAPVKRLVVVPLFFGTPTLERVFGPEKRADKDKADKPKNAAKPLKNEKPEQPAPPPDARLLAYADQLKKLQEHAQTALPERAAARTPFHIVAGEDVTKALKALDWTPANLFLNNGRIKGDRFALPDTQAVRKLAGQLQADAVLLGVLDEPRRTNSRYFFDPLYGLSYETAHVRSKAGFFLLTADGTEILHDYVESLHPVTKIGSKDYVLVDWIEAQDQVFESLMDEVSRYTPEKPASL